jgi:hypothetical protein
VDTINGTVSHLADTGRQLDNPCNEFGFEDACAITQEMECGKLFIAFPIEMTWTAKKKLEEAEQKEQKYESQFSKLAVLLKMTDTNLLTRESMKLPNAKADTLDLSCD